MLQPVTKEAYMLLHQGALAMAEIERNGIRVDVAYLDRIIEEVKAEIRESQERLMSSEVMNAWRKHFGTGLNLNSHQQLGTIVFDVLGHERNPLCKDSNNQLAFKHVKDPFVVEWFGAQKLEKAMGTFLFGIKKEIVNGYIHSFFDLHTTESLRSSSSRPNFQNMPVRNKKIAQAIRTCVIPRDGCVLVAGDYSSAEVRSSCFYHHDPIFERYVLGGGDMHADAARDVYKLTREELGDIEKFPGDKLRYCAKNMLVFPGFYGSYYKQMAPNLWDAIDTFDLTTAQGVPLVEHLKKKGIHARGKCEDGEEPVKGTFEYQVKQAQEAFWDRFKVYDQWKRDFWDLYQRQGGVNTLTGFKLEGVFRRNQVLCNSNQGTAFHLLLWSVIEIMKEIKRRGMKARIVMQIHDDVVGDVPVEEKDDYIQMVHEITTKRVREHWDWISVPLDMDFKVCQENWFEGKRAKVA